ncbi:MAG: phage integrase N-terminal SAM-like domain-containing protein [Sulfurimicrobium sp.]|nr:phage integrase N-terminal SAM-like domain-containing protein [Sulfurimicrobium sp.]
MEALSDANFIQNYHSHLQHLKLKGLQPKTIEAYSRAIRRIGEYFDHQIDNLTEQQLADYFSGVVAASAAYESGVPRTGAPIWWRRTRGAQSSLICMG